MREALCSALEARGALAGTRVLDLFAGTGALGLEALSRGAAEVVAIERDRQAVDVIKENAAALTLTDRIRVLELDLTGTTAKVGSRLRRVGAEPFTLVFADPPYAELAPAVRLLSELADEGLLAPGARVVLEHGSRDRPQPPAAFFALARYDYGDTAVALWETIAPAAQT